MNTLGTNIKEARKQAGLTQMELAKLTNLSRSYIGDIEKDRYNPSLTTLKAIAIALNKPLDTILTNNINKEENENTVTTHDKKKPAQLEKILEESEIMFDGELVKLNEEDKQTLKDAIELIYYRAKQKNKRKK